MSIFFPPEQPIKFFPWAKRLTALDVQAQVVHFRDKGMFQMSDPAFATNRVFVLNAAFTPVAEITPPEMDIQTIWANNVYTWEVSWDDHADVGERLFIAVVDANTNKYIQNYVVNSSFDTLGQGWAQDTESITIGSGFMTFTTVSGDTGAAVYNLPVFIGKDYTFNVSVFSNTGGVAAGFYNGATLIDSLSVGDNTFTFTATDTEVSIEFALIGAGTMQISSVEGKMAYEDVQPEWISAPFCLKDIADTSTLIHGCGNNDYFNMYFETTGFIPRLRVRAQLDDTAPIQEVERAFLTNGKTNNHYVQHVSLKELRIDWFPSYLVNFLAIAPYLDHFYVDNEPYSLAEDIEVQEDADAPQIKAIVMMVTPKTSGVSFKRVVNDPDTNECALPISDGGAYTQQGTGEVYTQQGTGDTYFAQQ